MTRPYERLLTTDRLRRTSLSGRGQEAEVLSDNARILTSSAFRRLQTKAQVFSLEQNAAIRSRLTHTLEVSMFGGLIAGRVFEDLRSGGLIDERMRFSFIKTVENACLLHDIGNPPFGHLGEFAIQEWFNANLGNLLQSWENMGVFSPQDIKDEVRSGFLAFDGNPQGFRIVTKLQWHEDEFGLNLSCSLLASMVKYLSYRRNEKATFQKKPGFFFSESEEISRIWSMLGLKTNEEGLPAQRHPLAFLMEAADDIAFCLSDIEDAIEKRIVTQREFFDSVAQDLGRFIPDLTLVDKATTSRNARFINFRVDLTRELVSMAAQAFLDKQEEILAGEQIESLLAIEEEAEGYLSALKTFSAERIFSSTEAMNVELSGYRVVFGLFENFGGLLDLGRDEFRLLLPFTDGQVAHRSRPREKRLVSLLAHKHLLAYEHACREKPRLEPLHRTQLVADYISGMTDGHALKVYQMLRGIRVGETL